MIGFQSDCEILSTFRTLPRRPLYRLFPIELKPVEDRRPAEENGDVEMEDLHGPGYSYSRHSSNGARRDRQERDDHGSENTNASNPQSPRRETRSTRGSRGTRNEGNAIAAVAAAAAEAEAAAATTVVSTNILALKLDAF